jgi:hypothetical protein
LAIEAWQEVEQGPDVFESPVGGCSLRLADLDLSHGGQELTRPLEEVKKYTNGKQSELNNSNGGQEEARWPLEEYRDGEQDRLNNSNGGHEATRPREAVKKCPAGGEQVSLGGLSNRGQEVKRPPEGVKDYEQVSLMELNNRLTQIMEANTRHVVEDDRSGSDAEAR